MQQDRTREELLSHAFTLLVDSLVDADDVAEILHRLIRACCELLPARAGAILLDDQRGGLAVVASTSEESRLLEVLQMRDGDGPCVEALRTGTSVESTDLDADAERWPLFVAGATAAGYRSVSAVPLRLREQTIGALNLFRDVPGALADSEHRLAESLAHVAVICMTQLESANRSSVLTEQLQHALDSRVVIEQAKGVLAERHDLDMDAAFAMLRDYARHHNLRLAEAAKAVARGEAQPFPRTDRSAVN